MILGAIVGLLILALLEYRRRIRREIDRVIASPRYRELVRGRQSPRSFVLAVGDLPTAFRLWMLERREEIAWAIEEVRQIPAMIRMAKRHADEIGEIARLYPGQPVSFRGIEFDVSSVEVDAARLARDAGLRPARGRLVSVGLVPHRGRFVGTSAWIVDSPCDVVRIPPGAEIDEASVVFPDFADHAGHVDAVTTPGIDLRDFGVPLSAIEVAHVSRPVDGRPYCYKPWCGVDGKRCIDCAQGATRR